MRISSAILLAVTFFAQRADAQITAERVRESIVGGVTYLKSQQNPVRGNWSEHVGYPGGVSALCTLALLNCGEERVGSEI